MKNAIDIYLDVIMRQDQDNSEEAIKASSYLKRYVDKRFCDELRLIRKFRNNNNIDVVARNIAFVRNDKTSWQQAYDVYSSYFNIDSNLIITK